MTLDDIKKEVQTCTKCELYKTRGLPVVGEGTTDAKYMFIGEGPGTVENDCGIPFIGKSGKLLRLLIRSSFKKEYPNIYITNVLKCRPSSPSNYDRRPTREEIKSCVPFLHRQIEIIEPSVIITVGSTATNTILGAKYKITSIRGGVYYYLSTKVVPIYHPSFILRNGGRNSIMFDQTYEDLLRVKNLIP